MKKILIISVIILGSCLAASMLEYKEAREKYLAAAQTIKAYDAQLDTTKVSNRAYKMTIDQMENSMDSVLREFQSIRKELKIKKKDVQSVQYISSVIHKTDTLVMNDTILRTTAQNLDTVVENEWYRLNLKLLYPDTAIISPNFKSSQYIVAHLKKETIDPPKKWWWQRLFQKKQKVLQVEVVEKNPYIDVKTNKYVEVLK